MAVPDVPPSDRTATAPTDAASAVGGPPPVVDRVLQDLQDAGLAPSAVERVVSWWKRFGGRTAIMLGLGIVGPVLRYEYVPYVLSTTVETMAAGYGLELSVGEWDGSLTDIAIVGKDVALATRGPFRERLLFQADAVTFDWSLTRAAANGWARVKGCWTAIVFQPCTMPDEVFHRVTVDGGTLHLERTMAGTWNAMTAFDVTTLDDLSRLVTGMRIPQIDARDMTVAWVEHLPGDSGGGLLEQRTSKLEFSHVTIGLDNLQLPLDARENPTRFTFDGETADGEVSVAGVLNVSRWAGDAWAPSYDLTFTLANFGAAALGRFATPDATLVPKTGTVDGTVRMASDGAKTTACRLDLALRDVTYAANPRSPYHRSGGRPLDAQLAPVRVTEVVRKDCLEPSGDAPGPDALPVPRVSPASGRTTQRLQTIVTASALSDAPPLVRGAASFDQATVVGGQTFTPEQIRADVAAQLGQALAGDRGAAVARSLAAPEDGGNAVTRGARSVGRGIRRLFGGGSKPAKKPAGR